MKFCNVIAPIMFLMAGPVFGGNGTVTGMSAMDFDTLMQLESMSHVDFVTDHERTVLVKGITTEIDLSQPETNKVRTFSGSSLIEINRLITDGDVDSAIITLEEKLEE